MAESMIDVCLFGEPSIAHKSGTCIEIETRKTQELFYYLLLHRSQRHSRERLASLLWRDTHTSQSKTYLRKTIWQLQDALSAGSDDHSIAHNLLLIDAQTIQVNPEANIAIDIDMFEHTFLSLRRLPGEQFDSSCAARIQVALDLYRGDLLQGWYQDWCSYDRERYRQAYFFMVDKLMSYYEACHAYEEALYFGNHILRYDSAHERTHYRLMRLYHLAGDRTAALRQYEHCSSILQHELGVAPTEETVQLYHTIRADQLRPDPTRLPAVATTAEDMETSLHDALAQLQACSLQISALHSQVQHSMRIIEHMLEKP